MNDFDKRMNALRIKYRDEQVRITKDCLRHIGHLNTAIGQVTTIEARDALRAEKHRVYEAQRTSHQYNRLCYMQQIEAIQDECRSYYEKNLTAKKKRRMFHNMLHHMAMTAEANGEKSVSMTIGQDLHATITFD